MPRDVILQKLLLLAGVQICTTYLVAKTGIIVMRFAILIYVDEIRVLIKCPANLIEHTMAYSDYED